MIDAHQHFWRTADQEQPWRTPAHHGLERDFTPDDLASEAAGTGVTGTVLVQSVDDPGENDRLARFAAESALVRGVVAWLPLTDPEGARREWRRFRIPRLVGVRCLIGNDGFTREPDPATLGLFAELARAGLSWDVVPLTATQCEIVAAIARSVPDLRVVIDHLARPPLTGESVPSWEANLKRLAAEDGVAIKLSVGLDVVSRWRWDQAALADCVARAVHIFGADRAMVASNWPVSTLQASYADAIGGVARIVTDLLGAADRDRVLTDSAARWYRLDQGERA